jgi:hypothetical protein
MSNKLEVYHKLSTIGGSVIALECANFLMKDCDKMIAECREDLQLSCVLDSDEIDMIESQMQLCEGIKRVNKVIYDHYKYILN